MSVVQGKTDAVRKAHEWLVEDTDLIRQNKEVAEL